MPRKKNSAPRSKSPSKGQPSRKSSNPQLATQASDSKDTKGRKVDVVAEAPELGPPASSTKKTKESVEKQEEKPITKLEEKPVEKQEKPIKKPAKKQEDRPVEKHEKPVEEPIEKQEKPIKKPAKKQEDRPIQKQEKKPVEKHEKKPVEEPIEKSEKKSAEKQEKPIKKPVEKQDHRSVEKQEENPVAEHEKTPVEKHEKKPAETQEKPVEKPIEKQEEKPVEKQEKKPVEKQETPVEEQEEKTTKSEDTIEKKQPQPSPAKTNGDEDSNGNADAEKSFGSDGTADETLVDGFDSDKQESTEVKSMSDENYPRLSLSTHGRRNSTRYGWKAGGIRFAPVQVPFSRRLQTAAVLFHGLSILTFVAIFFFLAAVPFTWPLLVPYLIHLSLSSVASDGSLKYRSEWLRSRYIWKLFADYYPAELHKTHDLPPTRKYIFGYHPHGIISHGAFAAFATNALGFAEQFPGITNSLLTLDNNFRIPLYRDYILAMGVRSVSKESIWNTLSKGGRNGEGMGRAVTIVVGGARESLEAQPGTLRLILKGRKGFIKMALRTGADIVPVLGFGENDLYDQLSPRTHPWVHNFQMFVLRVFKFTLPALHGRGILNYDVGMMPYRRPLNIVVGKPIKVTTAPTAQPSQEEIDRLHELYVIELQKIWDTYKEQFAPERKAEFQFIA
ncbi:Diacylglycerol O-acyltransferase 2A [Colletotrichum spinosum]|uniref:diacylglycerol O-acyltransferase n=1 Tax=Colletotrichum spinosum TaxID=1347390 RepID=A0A4R8PX74_9PEZI|nr:Diacylglycerol O-acyltransferase 2A [Colletotrichum spinosum]